MNALIEYMFLQKLFPNGETPVRRFESKASNLFTGFGWDVTVNGLTYRVEAYNTKKFDNYYASVSCEGAHMYRITPKAKLLSGVAKEFYENARRVAQQQARTR